MPGRMSDASAMAFYPSLFFCDFFCSPYLSLSLSLALSFFFLSSSLVITLHLSFIGPDSWLFISNRLFLYDDNLVDENGQYLGLLRV